VPRFDVPADEERREPAGVPNSLAVPGKIVRSERMTLTGFDQGPDFPGKMQESVGRSAESSAVPAPPSTIDPDLARILDIWPSLAEPIRRAVLALVESAGPRLP